MKDDVGGLVTGILIHGEIQRQNDEARKKQQRENDELNRKNNQLATDIKKQQAQFQSENDDLEYENLDLIQKNNRLFKKAQELQNEVDRLNILLRQPLAEIAKQHVGFSQNYEKLMETLADWMVSQKAFKELAIQFGLKQGISAEEVIQQGRAKEIDVLENKHNQNHNTNVFDSTIIGPRVEKLKEKLLSK